MNRYPIRDSDNAMLGWVEIPPGHIKNSFDFALTPIVTLDVDDPRIHPEVSGFLASKRTVLRTGARSTEHPYRYLDPKLNAEEYPDG